MEKNHQNQSIAKVSFGKNLCLRFSKHKMPMERFGFPTSLPKDPAASGGTCDLADLANGFLLDT